MSTPGCSLETRRRSVTPQQEVVLEASRAEGVKKESSLSSGREKSTIQSMTSEEGRESPISRGVNGVLRFCGSVIRGGVQFLRKEDSDEEDALSSVVTEGKRKRSAEHPASKSICVQGGDNTVEAGPSNDDFLVVLKQINANLAKVVEGSEKEKAEFNELKQGLERSLETTTALIAIAMNAEKSPEREAKLTKLRSGKQELEKLMSDVEEKEKAHVNMLRALLKELDQPFPPRIEQQIRALKAAFAFEES